MLPFGIPFTDQVTLASVVFATVAVNESRCMGASVAIDGETFTVT
jgi:hypothetical protein